MKHFFLFLFIALICLQAPGQRQRLPRPLPSRWSIQIENVAGARVLSPGALATITGKGFVTGSAQGNIGNPPDALAGCMVAVNGTLAGITWVSESAIMIVVPELDPDDLLAIVTVRTPRGVWNGQSEIARVSPSLFSGDATGMSAMGYYRVGLGDPQPLGLDELRIDPSLPTVIVLVGSGFRHAQNVQIALGSQTLAPQRAGAFPGLAGWDSVSFVLYGDLYPRGDVRCQVLADGRASNEVWLRFPNGSL